MSSLLYDKADVRICNDDLFEINEWAKKHAAKCGLMYDVISGYGVMHYGVEYCATLNEFDIVGYCPCGCRYYVGKGEEPPIKRMIIKNIKNNTEGKIQWMFE